MLVSKCIILFIFGVVLITGTVATTNNQHSQQVHSKSSHVVANVVPLQDKQQPIINRNGGVPQSQPSSSSSSLPTSSLVNQYTGQYDQLPSYNLRSPLPSASLNYLMNSLYSASGIPSQRIARRSGGIDGGVSSKQLNSAANSLVDSLYNLNAIPDSSSTGGVGGTTGNNGAEFSMNNINALNEMIGSALNTFTGQVEPSASQQASSSNNGLISTISSFVASNLGKSKRLFDLPRQVYKTLGEKLVGGSSSTADTTTTTTATAATAPMKDSWLSSLKSFYSYFKPSRSSAVIPSYVPANIHASGYAPGAYSQQPMSGSSNTDLLYNFKRRTGQAEQPTVSQSAPQAQVQAQAQQQQQQSVAQAQPQTKVASVTNVAQSQSVVSQKTAQITKSVPKIGVQQQQQQQQPTTGVKEQKALNWNQWNSYFGYPKEQQQQKQAQESQRQLQYASPDTNYHYGNVNEIPQYSPRYPQSLPYGARVTPLQQQQPQQPQQQPQQQYVIDQYGYLQPSQQQQPQHQPPKGGLYQKSKQLLAKITGKRTTTTTSTTMAPAVAEALYQQLYHQQQLAQQQLAAAAVAQQQQQTSQQSQQSQTQQQQQQQQISSATLAKVQSKLGTLPTAFNVAQQQQQSKQQPQQPQSQQQPSYYTRQPSIVNNNNQQPSMFYPNYLDYFSGSSSGSLASSLYQQQQQSQVAGTVAGTVSGSVSSTTPATVTSTSVSISKSVSSSIQSHGGGGDQHASASFTVIGDQDGLDGGQQLHDSIVSSDVVLDERHQDVSGGGGGGSGSGAGEGGQLYYFDNASMNGRSSDNGDAHEEDQHHSKSHDDVSSSMSDSISSSSS